MVLLNYLQCIQEINMKLKNLTKLMGVLGYKDYGIDKMTLLQMAFDNDPTFTLEAVKKELVVILQMKGFDWVELAINSEFVYASNEIQPIKFGVDDLLIFTDSYTWEKMVQADAVLSTDQKNELKEQFRECGVQHYLDIEELLYSNDFEWLPFEVKHTYLHKFKNVSYSNSDIIFHLKALSWKYLYPNSFDSDRLNSIKEESLPLLQGQKENEGWIEMSQVLESIKDKFPGIDLFELSRVDWGQDIQHKSHYRNPFTLGFKRIAPESLTTEQQYS